MNHEHNPTETCILCHKETHYRFKDHIDTRIGYIEGAGQLCSSCYLAGSAEGRESVVVPKSLIMNTSNNYELGEKVRKLMWDL
jgi:hypothetical protein